MGPCSEVVTSTREEPRRNQRSTGAGKGADMFLQGRVIQLLNGCERLRTVKFVAEEDVGWCEVFES